MADSRKRPAPSFPPPWQHPAKDQKRGIDQDRPQRPSSGNGTNDRHGMRKDQELFAREQTRLNQIQEAEQMREWVAKEDEFVLQQSKKKARIRVREGRAKPIDWLAVTLGVIDSTKDLLDDDDNETDVDIVDPTAIFEGCSLPQIQDLSKDIERYMVLETNNSNRRYWTALQVICKDHLDRMGPAKGEAHTAFSVSTDIDRLLNPKSLRELEILETQISSKLESNEPIDVEYWERLMRNVSVHKSRAELNNVYQTIIGSRLASLRSEQRAEASNAREKLALVLHESGGFFSQLKRLSNRSVLDPEPSLKIQAEDKSLDVVDEQDFLDKNASERQRVTKLKYVPSKPVHSDKKAPTPDSRPAEAPVANASRFAPAPNEDFSSATKALYEREVARGVQEDEEIFAGEEEVFSAAKPKWASKHRPRKPRYFNRVQMGYEWNKYNQTHYDHDNPPPKVVQGYKFNIFYPDLIDKVKAPTYRIERENGRKRGESFAPAGEEDTCLIRFISGPPYEDLAFRIVDKEWDYSAKRERGFRSSFDKVS
ncbi:hypothetical protein ACLMJK_008592 [Lecanora helva]